MSEVMKKRKRKITLEIRMLLEAHLKAGKLKKIEIAKKLKISPATISLELSRCKGEYNAIEAQEDCEAKYQKKINGLVSSAKDEEVRLHGHRLPSCFVALKTNGKYFLHDTRKRRGTFLGVVEKMSDIPDFFEIII